MSDSFTDVKTSITTVLTSEDYRRAWPKLKSELEAFCEDLSETGAFNMLNVLIDAASWALQHPPADAADPPVPRLPEAPAEAPAAASQATVTRRTEQARIAAKAEKAERLLRRAIEHGLGPVARDIQIPGSGLRTLRTWEIMSMAEVLCTPTHEDIAALEVKLTAWDYSLTFGTNIANLGDTIYLLNERGLCTHEYEKIKAFDKATAGNLDIDTVRGRYHTAHSDECTRTYAQMVHFFKQQLPSVLLAAARHAEAMHAVAASAELATLRQENAALKATAAAAAAAHGAASTTTAAIPGGGGRGHHQPGRGGGSRGGGRGGRGQQGRGPQAQPFFCFAHGSRVTHWGTTCTKMENDTSYTQAMKNATGPCTLPDATGKMIPSKY